VTLPGTRVLMSVWEVRVKDYQSFATSMKRIWPKAGFAQGQDHPAVNISWEDAKAYAQWLTAMEHQIKELPSNWRYRLPTDAEWSVAVGLPPASVASEDPLLLATHFPWKGDWPPPQDCGNYHPSLGVDRFAKTAPVGSFPANALGLFDLGGNVWEWCENIFNQSPDFRVLRGASWRMRNPGDLISARRIGNRPNLRLPVYGCRLVIEVRGEEEVPTP
jgi:formylglycine-generating enzyme required for sulfatase activity